MVAFMQETLHNVRKIDAANWKKHIAGVIQQDGKINEAKLAAAAEALGVGQRQQTAVKWHLSALEQMKEREWPAYKEAQAFHDRDVLRGVEAALPSASIGAQIMGWDGLSPRDPLFKMAIANPDQARTWWEKLDHQQIALKRGLAFADRHVADPSKRYGNYREGLLNLGGDGTGPFRMPVRREVHSVFKVTRQVDNPSVYDLEITGRGTDDKATEIGRAHV